MLPKASEAALLTMAILLLLHNYGCTIMARLTMARLTTAILTMATHKYSYTNHGHTHYHYTHQGERRLPSHPDAQPRRAAVLVEVRVRVSVRVRVRVRAVQPSSSR